MKYSKENLEEILRKVANRMVSIQNEGLEEECPISIINVECWEWPQGVGMYGLLNLPDEIVGDHYLEYMIDWYNRRIEEGLPAKNINTMAPMLTLAHLYEKTGNTGYLDLCKEWAEWCMEKLPRTEEGGFQHVVSGDTNSNEQQLWDDTLFMTVLFLAKMGKVLNRSDYIQASVKQFLIHIKYLYDRKTGLWFHGWTFKERNNFAEALWARGNCWYTAGVVDYIEIVEPDEGIKQYLLDTLNAQVEKLAQLQEPNGMWHTLLDDPNSYLEASATAGFGYGILKAIRKGYIDKKYEIVGRRALEGVIDHIDENGTVQQVSYGTAVGLDLDSYRNIPICPMTYGQALTILLLSEGLKL